MTPAVANALRGDLINARSAARKHDRAAKDLAGQLKKVRAEKAASHALVGELTTALNDAGYKTPADLYTPYE